MILLDEESKRENFQEVSLTAQELTFRYEEEKRGDKKMETFEDTHRS